MDPFQRAIPGHQIVHSASAHNAMIEAALANRQTQLTLRTEIPSAVRPVHVILVRNDTEHDVPRFGVLGISGLIIEPDDNEAEFRAGPIFTGRYPLADDVLVYPIEPIAEDKIGEAVLIGAAIVKLNVVDDDHTWAKVVGTSTETTLQTSWTGTIPIIWKESGTGSDKWGVVMAGGPGECQMVLGKTDASHAKGASGTVSIWRGTFGSEADTGENVEAFNRFANVGSGKWVIVARVGGQWYLISAEC